MSLSEIQGSYRTGNYHPHIREMHFSDIDYLGHFNPRIQNIRRFCISATCLSEPRQLDPQDQLQRRDCPGKHRKSLPEINRIFETMKPINRVDRSKRQWFFTTTVRFALGITSAISGRSIMSHGSTTCRTRHRLIAADP